MNRRIIVISLALTGNATNGMDLQISAPASNVSINPYYNNAGYNPLVYDMPTQITVEDNEMHRLKNLSTLLKASYVPHDYDVRVVPFIGFSDSVIKECIESLGIELQTEWDSKDKDPGTLLEKVGEVIARMYALRLEKQKNESLAHAFTRLPKQVWNYFFHSGASFEDDAELEKLSKIVSELTGLPVEATRERIEQLLAREMFIEDLEIIFDNISSFIFHFVDGGVSLMSAGSKGGFVLIEEDGALDRNECKNVLFDPTMQDLIQGIFITLGARYRDAHALGLRKLPNSSIMLKVGIQEGIEYEERIGPDTIRPNRNFSHEMNAVIEHLISLLSVDYTHKPALVKLLLIPSKKTVYVKDVLSLEDNSLESIAAQNEYEKKCKVQHNKKQAAEWIKTARKYLAKKEWEKTKDILEIIASQTDDLEIQASAKYYLGVLYHEGSEVKQDYKKAREYYEQAAAQTDDLISQVRAKYYLGNLYLEGKGGKQSFKKAHEYYKQVAAQMHDLKFQAKAKLNLGVSYDMGWGVSYHDAAGVSYHEGWKVKPDKKKALIYYKQVAAQTDDLESQASAREILSTSVALQMIELEESKSQMVKFD